MYMQFYTQRTLQVSIFKVCVHVSRKQKLSKAKNKLLRLFCIVTYIDALILLHRNMLMYCRKNSRN